MSNRELLYSVEDSLYRCTKNIAFPKNEVIEAIFAYVEQASDPSIHELYDYLGSYFQVNSFNMKNLKELTSMFFDIGKYGLLIKKPDIDIRKFVIEPNVNTLTREMNTKNSSIIALFSKLVLLQEQGLIESESNTLDIDNVQPLIRILKRTFRETYSQAQIESSIFLFTELFQTYGAINNEFQKTFIESMSANDFSVIKYNRTQRLINAISKNNDDLLVDRLFRVDIVCHLSELGINTVSDFKRKFSREIFDIIDVDSEEIDTILKSLSEDIQKVTRTIFQEMLLGKREDDKVLGILIKRSQSKTLEEIGGELKVTRERIRQIEKKGFERFQDAFPTKVGKLLLILIRAQINNPLAIEFQEIEQILGDLSSVFIYLAERLEADEIFVSTDYELLVLAKENWLVDVEEMMESLNTTITETELFTISQSYVENLFERMNIRIDIKIILNILRNQYLQQGTVYTKKRFNKSERYVYLVSRYFPEGIHIYDDKEISELKKFYLKEFNDTTILPQSTRTIGTAIARKTVLVDRGKYDLVIKLPKLPSELKGRIEQFIESADTVIMLLRVYKTFENELFHVGVKNRFILQSVLKNEFEDRYFYRKDYISKDKENFDLASLMDQRISEYTGIFTIDEVDKLFPSVNNVVVLTYLLNDPKYISAFDRKWINGENLKYTDEEVEAFKTTISELLRNKEIIATQEVFDKTRIKYSAFYERNLVEYQFFLFGILRFLFEDEFEFARPFIARKGIEIKKKEERLIEFINKSVEVSIPSLKLFAAENGIYIYSLSEFIDEISQSFYWAAEDLLVHKSQIKISDDVVSDFEDIVLQMLGDRAGINTSNVNTRFLPKLKYPWNKYLIAAVIKMHAKRLKIINTTSFHNTTDFIVVKSNLHIDDYASYLKITKEV